MSDDRLAAIEAVLGKVVDRGDELAVGQAELRAGVTELRAGVTGLRTGVSELRTGHAELQAGQKRLEARIEEVDRHMHVLHENVLDRIAAIPTDGPTKVEVKRWLDDHGEALGRRLDPLEAAVRRHTEEIERLKNARG